MGEANQRGTYEERREQSLERLLDEAEVLVFLTADSDGKLRIRTLPRDETPNQDSLAVIFASFLNANFAELAGQAIALYTSHAAAQAGMIPMEGAVIAEPGKRSVVDSQGNIASMDVRLAGGESS